MEFAYTPRLAELKDRARTLTEKIIPFEDECERNNGLCPDSHASIKAAVLDSGLQAINTPAEFGGAGLSVLEQVVVQDELGKLTNALWDTVWRPANPLAHATPEQRERYLIPGARGDRRDAVAISEAGAGSDFSAALTSATPDGDGGYVINGEKWFVTVGDVADYLHRAGIRAARARSDHVPRRCRHPGCEDHQRSPLHAHVRLRASRIHLRERAASDRMPCWARSARDSN